MTKKDTPPSPDSETIAEQPVIVAPPPGMFGDSPAKTIDCLVMIYDFENFTGFLSIPDIHRDVAGYLNLVDGHVRRLIDGGPIVGLQQNLNSLDLKLLHEKFVGDGVMFILQVGGEDEADRSSNIRAFCRRLVYLKNHFSKVNAEAMRFMPVADLPQRIRFGITYGTLIELPRTNGTSEYVGFAINIAARLQKYSGNVSFLASARLPHADKWMTQNGFVKVKATQLRGRPNEFVYIDEVDFTNIKKTKDAVLFEEIALPASPASKK
ncbi:MAG: hypothetical protein KA171_14655 [Reyranella sp.]|nr:hypothetical protein [Reyranella sp.]